jgi:hypothetical protein
MHRSEDRPATTKPVAKSYSTARSKTGQVTGLDFSTVLRWKTAAREGGIQR